MADVFILQLATMLATDGPVCITKVGRSFVLKSKNNKATVPQTLARKLQAALVIAKKAAK